MSYRPIGVCVGTLAGGVPPLVRCEVAVELRRVISCTLVAKELS
jgi:hypothetical protein